MNERDLLRRIKDDPERFEGSYDKDFNQDRPRKMRMAKDRSFKPRRQKPQWKRQDDE